MAAAQASAYSLALSRLLSTRNMTPKRIDTTATVIGRADDGLAITAVHLGVNAWIPDADRAEFETMAQQAKSACLVSPLLNVEITLETHLDTARGTGARPMQGTLRLRHRRPRITAMRS
ncbi:Osmotically inducible protein C [Salinisphaera sp. LB1]|nr:Osmotically inducible protein C [Salinisphaera sp. LB1]